MHPPDLDPTRRILEGVAAGTAVSQRSLARHAGIALGLTNLLIRRMVAKGWVRMVALERNRVKYLITPAGIAEHARRSREYLYYSVRFYREARRRIGERLEELSAEWPERDRRSGTKRLVFCSTGEVAEIGYVCLQSTDFALVGVVDVDEGANFFGLPVKPYEALRHGELDGVPFEKLVVMSFGDCAVVQQLLERAGYPIDDVFWI